MQVPDVVHIDVFGKKGGVPLEIWRAMDVELRLVGRGGKKRVRNGPLTLFPWGGQKSAWRCLWRHG